MNPLIRNHARCRRGAAPLELVMGLPMLLAIVASTWSIGKVGLGKQEAAIEARQDVWAQRTDPTRRSSELSSQRIANPSEAMETLDPSADIFIGDTEEEVRVARWMGRLVAPEGRAAIVVGTWDHTQIDMNRFAPHFFLFPKLARQTGSGISAALQGDMSNFFRDLTVELVSLAMG